ncbi:arsenate reductase (glutaredoxin) [Riemerella columbina]|uniref:arsenate reductase (glutaredoxin) n=1 Tax=Riemerella columbina TaxID=103810 RepID=UPI00267030FE|nr:arsenate reductase (glutaredoxin) [Riemerella columbina]WKS94721.1 arsenate reductase (glutaredoxin) [Riemerella columbina]
MKTVLYHNNRCSKSRCALEFLNEQKEDLTIVNLLKDGVTREQLEEVLTLLKMKPSELIRKSDAFFKDLYGEKSMQEEDYLQAMIEHPRLIQRPIVVKNGKAAIGRPLENIEAIL